MEKMRQWEEDGYSPFPSMKQFCHERAEDALKSRGLKVDEVSGGM
jgi:hypothetical protein